MTPRLMSAIVATVGALVFAGVATAHSDHQGAKGAKVYRAKLVKTAAADTAQLPDVTGKAQLVDGKKRNKISIHVRGLTPGATYTWHIHKAANATDDPCAPSAPVVDGTPYGDWVYRALTANEAGNASAKAKSIRPTAPWSRAACSWRRPRSRTPRTATRTSHCRRAATRKGRGTGTGPARARTTRSSPTRAPRRQRGGRDRCQPPRRSRPSPAV
jgi:hypothetical protein